MEKRVLYALVVILTYLVGSGFGQGEVKVVIEEAKWKQLVINAQVPVVLRITSPLCGVPCVILKDEVTRLVQTYGDKIKFYTADILLNPFFLQLYEVLNVPTLIVFKDGKEIIRFDKLSDWGPWGNIYDTVFQSAFDSAMPSFGSTSPSPSPSGQ